MCQAKVLYFLCYVIMCIAKSGIPSNTLTSDGQHTERISAISVKCGTRSNVYKQTRGVNKANLVTISPIEVINRPKLDVCHEDFRQTFRVQNLTNVVCDSFNTSRSCKKAKLGLLNAQSVCNKTECIEDFIIEHKLDICAITETWLSSNDDLHARLLTPNGYTSHTISRSNKRGGGVAIISKDSYNQSIKSLPEFTYFEVISVCLKYTGKRVRIVCIYRPPSSNPSTFLHEFSTLLEDITLQSDQIVICGDFNIHLDVANNAFASHFMDILDCFALKQHVKTATHASGHTLDCIITRDDEGLLKPPVIGPLISDHFSLLAVLPFSSKESKKTHVSYRKIRNINLDLFQSDLKQTVSTIDLESDLTALLDTYNCKLTELMDKHAPLVSKEITVRPHRPWFDDSCEHARLERRRLELCHFK